jgi:hypothetical protein
VALATHALAQKEASSVYPEKHPSQAASPHSLDIDALGKDSHFSTTHKGRITRLLEHSLTDRKQNDHHPHAQGKAGEEEERSELPDEQMAKRQGSDHDGVDEISGLCERPAEVSD